MQYSPKLKKAIAEIKETMLKYDIAGTVVLHTPGFAEYLVHFTPTYSCAKLDPLTNEFRMKALKKDFDNEAERINKIEDTANMVASLTDVNAMICMNLMVIKDKVDEITQAEHFGDGFSSAQEQQN